jgi:membrane-bound lytic murein transglycosylase D
MKRFLPRALGGLCALFAPALVLCQPHPVVLGAASSLVDSKEAGNLSAYFPDERDIPTKLLDVMRMSELRYTEGSNLIKAGESARARAAFDEAVNLVLRSEWDLPSTPVLSKFFQDLINRIQRDESRYLRPDVGTEEKSERAVVDELEKLDLIPIQVDPALKDAVEADILDSRYDIPIVVNESVLKSMNFWLSRGRRYFVDGLSRSGQYKEMIERIFREESVPRDLMYLAQVESLFKPNALSRALAKGIWQFARGTAIRYGLKVNRYVDERSDPEKSTRAAARYLNDLYAMFNDWNLVLAAYNWGEGKIQKLVDQSGESDFWRLTTLKRKMPAETKNHVPMVLASIILANNPEKYGLPVELEASLNCDRVSIPKRINLTAAAKALDVPLETLKKLNPALKTSYTPPDYPNFELNVPAGLGADFAEKLAALPNTTFRADPEFNGRHKVLSGETLGSISLRYGVSVEDLQAANDIRSPQSLRAGTWILVPTSPTAARPARVSIPAPATRFGGEHMVKPGETLASIAQSYGVSAADLQKANKIASAKSLLAGSSIRVPAAAPGTVPVAEPAATRQHQVASGETLYSIAARYHVTVAALQKANRIRQPQSLQVGVWLKIPSEEGAAGDKLSIARKS